jgi:hypothetical protein
VKAIKGSRLQLIGIVVVLVALGVWGIWYKAAVLGYSMWPGQETRAWLLEAEVGFEATDEPVKVSLSVPGGTPGFRTLSEEFAAPDYGVSVVDGDGDRRVEWAARERSGPQTLFYRTIVFDAVGSAGVTPAAAPGEVVEPFFEEPAATAARSVLNDAVARSADPLTLAKRLIERLGPGVSSGEAEVLLRGRALPDDRVRLIIDLLAMHGVPARLARGVVLDDGRRQQPLTPMLEVHQDDAWQLVDPISGRPGVPADFILWQRGGRSLLDVSGGQDSYLRVSVMQNVRPITELGPARDTAGRLQLSVYALPISEQNVFKLLSLIPLGALVLCISRNVVGIATSGTFMPLLIALVLIETGLLNGLLIFTIIVTAGLAIRAYLSSLNLLLVPRISAVVVVVIGLMAVLGVFGHQLGFHGVLAVTLFPFIVVAWTIERASTTWEEAGPQVAMTQLIGSVVVAVVVFFIWSLDVVQHVCYAFTEVNLIVLAVILALGSYTGYRLTELRRFAPLTD